MSSTVMLRPAPINTLPDKQVPAVLLLKGLLQVTTAGTDALSSLFDSMLSTRTSVAVLVLLPMLSALPLYCIVLHDTIGDEW
jgi:hypothetical protein